MKKLTFLLLSALMVLGLFTFCSDDDETIDGTWKYSSFTFDLKTNKPTLDSYIKKYVEEELRDDFVNASLELRTDGKVLVNGKNQGTHKDGVIYDSKSKKVATYLIDGKTLALEIDGTAMVLDDLDELVEELGPGVLEQLQDLVIEKAVAKVYFKK